MQHDTYWASPLSNPAGAGFRERESISARTKSTALVDRGVRACLDLTQAGELKPQGRVLAGLARERGITVAQCRTSIRDAGVTQAPPRMRAVQARFRACFDSGQPAHAHCWGGAAPRRCHPRESEARCDSARERIAAQEGR